MTQRKIGTRILRSVDLFAGAGGFSTGATMAGARVVYAANHWPEAVRIHSANHPSTRHVCQDLRQANWTEIPDHDLLLASPCCQGHSRARGKDGPAHDDSRQTAWAVVDAAEVKRPRFLVVENVEEFQSWILFPRWKACLEDLGYSLTFNRLNAADFGVPQARERLFIVGTLEGELEIKSPGLDHVAARKLVDWKSGSWSAIDRPGRAESTLRRIQAGRDRFGDRFITAFYGNDRGRSLEKPLGTVTTRDRFGLVDGDRMRMLTVEEYRKAMGFPAEYQLPRSRKTAIHLLGNAVCPPVAAEIVRQIQEVA
jgi:DNA (cytosine-5)-methyltransferase 1